MIINFTRHPSQSSDGAPETNVKVERLPQFGSRPGDAPKIGKTPVLNSDKAASVLYIVTFGVCNDKTVLVAKYRQLD